jgi:hypothetical protein
MKYLLTQIIVLILGVTLLYYFMSLDYFLPIGPDGSSNWYNIFYTLTLLFIILEGFLSITIYLTQKFTAYGRKEFPDKGFSLKWGIGLSLGFILLLLLNIFHLLSLPWGILVMILVVIVFRFIK